MQVKSVDKKSATNPISVPEESQTLPKVPFSTEKPTQQKREIDVHHHSNKKKPTAQKGLFDDDEEDSDPFFKPSSQRTATVSSGPKE